MQGRGRCIVRAAVVPARMAGRPRCVVRATENSFKLAKQNAKKYVEDRIRAAKYIQR